MVSLNYHDLQKAIYEKLTGNSSLMAIISGVFNYPPQSAVFPFIFIGNSNISELAALAGSVLEYQFNINMLAREAGHKQVAEIMEIVYGLLHNSTISVTGKTFIRPLHNTLNFQ